MESPKSPAVNSVSFWPMAPMPSPMESKARALFSISLAKLPTSLDACETCPSKSAKRASVLPPDFPKISIAAPARSVGSWILAMALAMVSNCWSGVIDCKSETFRPSRPSLSAAALPSSPAATRVFCILLMIPPRSSACIPLFSKARWRMTSFPAAMPVWSLKSAS